MQDLGAFGGLQSAAAGINDSEQVVGWAGSYSGHGHAFLNGAGTMQDLGTLGGLYSAGDGINDSGQIVGWGDNISGSGRAFLYSDGIMEDLNDLIDPSLGWTLAEATAINNNGQIVGWGTYSNGQPGAFLLTPTPEPSTFALLAAAAIGLFCFSWWRRRKNRASPLAIKPTILGDGDLPLQEHGPAILHFASQRECWIESARRAA